jgi:hypothetical protein
MRRARGKIKTYLQKSLKILMHLKKLNNRLKEEIHKTQMILKALIILKVYFINQIKAHNFERVSKKIQK